MKVEKQVDELLALYGKSLFNSHVDYFSSCTESDASYNDSPFVVGDYKANRFNFRRALSLCAAIIIVMLLGVSVCYAFGINVLKYIYTVDNDQIIVTNDNDEEGIHFYKPKYIVEGYRLCDVIHISDNNRCYVYESSNNSYIIIERLDKDAILFFDDVDANMETLEFEEYELKIINSKESSYMIALMQKENTRITIQGHLSVEEIKSIIRSLDIDGN